MGKIILVTGGSRSGKSRFAEELLKEQEDVMYIATAIVTDSEMEERIEKHRLRRNSKWITFEGFKALDKAIENSDRKHILLDCVTVMLTNLLFDRNIDFDSISRDECENLQHEIEKEFIKFLSSARDNDKNLVMVTNEVGYGLVPEYRLGRIFRDMAGSINQLLAGLSDEVYLVACGLPLKLK